MAYQTLRSQHNTLPEVATKELNAYADAMSARERLNQIHSERLSEISENLDRDIDDLDDTEAGYINKVEELNRVARKATDEENNQYAIQLSLINKTITEIFDSLSVEFKTILAAGAPELVVDKNAIKSISTFLETLDDATKELIIDLNNQSASTSIDIAVGYIPKAKYLRIPSHLAQKIYALWNTQPSTDTYANGLTAEEMISVAAVNYDGFKDLQGAEFFALLRAQICAILGAPRNPSESKVRFHEVVVVPTLSDQPTLKRITDWMRTNAHIVKNLRYFALNFICLSNHVLLTLRSHWKNDAQFTALWNNGLKGCLLDQLLAAFNHDRPTLFHDVIHPWGLWVLYQAHKDFAARDICDNSMKLRAEGAACGTAAYTGAAALLDQMHATKLFDKFFDVKADIIAEVQNTAKNIKKNRDKYSLNHRFYGHNGTEVLPLASVQAVAPVLMAYRDVFLKNTSFKDVKAIARVAENSDGVRKVLVERMKNLIKDEATKIEDLV